MTSPRPAVGPLPRGPFVLLGLMTTTTIGGPFLIGFALRGGPSPNWPPDRAVEWVTVLGVSAAVLALMGACVGLLWTNRAAVPTGLGRPGASGRRREVDR